MTMKPMLWNRSDEIDNPRFILLQVKVESERMGGREAGKVELGMKFSKGRMVETRESTNINFPEGK